MQNVKCVVVGDIGVGKTCLLCTYSNKEFPEFVPVIYYDDTITVMVGGKPYMLGLYDIIEHDDYDRLRPPSYARTDVFLVCFSVVSPDSLENVRKKWVPEIKKHMPRTPFLLVGTQTDLRDDAATIQRLANNNQQPITLQQGARIAKDLKAVRYVECSALTQAGLKNVFDQAILAAVAPKGRCAIQ